jgi:hypothetical protein
MVEQSLPLTTSPTPRGLSCPMRDEQDHRAGHKSARLWREQLHQEQSWSDCSSRRKLLRRCTLCWDVRKSQRWDDTDRVCVIRLFYESVILHAALCDVLCTIDTRSISPLPDSLRPSDGPSSWAMIRRWMTAIDGAVGVYKIPCWLILTPHS